MQPPSKDVWAALQSGSAGLDTPPTSPVDRRNLEARVAECERELKELKDTAADQDAKLTMLANILYEKGVTATSARAQAQGLAGASRSTPKVEPKIGTKVATKLEASRKEQADLGFASPQATVPSGLKPFPGLVAAVMLSVPEWEYKEVDTKNGVAARYAVRYHLRTVLPLEALNKKISQAVTLLREWFEVGR